MKKKTLKTDTRLDLKTKADKYRYCLCPICETGLVDISDSQWGLECNECRALFNFEDGTHIEP